MARFGIDTLIPRKLRPRNQEEPIEHPAIRREVDRLQRIVEGQNFEIRKTLSCYSDIVEQQREILFDWRGSLLSGLESPGSYDSLPKDIRVKLRQLIGLERLGKWERNLILHHIDEFWGSHLEMVTEVREWIHLVGICGRSPLHEFHKQIVPAFEGFRETIEERTARTLERLIVDGEKLRSDPELRAPTSTWTYLVNDQSYSGIEGMLSGIGNAAFSAVAVLTTWPLLLTWAIWRRLSRRRDSEG